MSAASPSSNLSPRAAFRQATIDSAPVFLPAIPFAFVVGVAINNSAMPRWVGVISSPAIWAGAAQLSTLTLAGSASLAAVIATGAVINSRHIMYSAAMAPRFTDQPRWFRIFGPYLMIDQIFALSNTVPDLRGAAFRHYYLGVGAFFWTGWHIFVTLGMILGPVVPAAWRFDAAPMVMFAGFVVLGISRRPGFVAALVSAMVGLLTLGLPNKLGLLVAALAGVVAGFVAERVLVDPAPSGTAIQ